MKIVGKILLFAGIASIVATFVSMIVMFMGPIETWGDNTGLIITFAVVGVPLLIIGIMLNTFSGHSGAVKTGVLVIGSLVEARQTGMYVNEQPQLLLTFSFKTADGRLITASDKKVVSFVDLAQFQPGAMFPLRYDPSNPEKIMLDFNVDQATMENLIKQYKIATGQITQETYSVIENGVHARGVIISSHPTGSIVDNKSEMFLQLKVTRPDGSTYDVEVTKPIPQEGIPHTVPGSIVEVFYMPNNEKDIKLGFYNQQN